MPNILGPTGLQLNTQQELVDYFSAQFRLIYGNDVNLEPSTPDGQLMMIFVQSILDVQDLLMQIYNQFDPDLAVGAVLDQRVAINGIQRQAGTYTVTNVTVTTTLPVTLYGLDQEGVEPVYTVSDNAGNEWQLITSINLPSPGAQVLAFQSAVPGEVLTVPNTITVPVTIILGVSQVNNPTTYTTLGINEESDYDLKIRRQRSVALSSQGYLAGLLAALENLSGMSAAFVYENNTGSTDGDGIPSHSIWVIVSGTATPASIANAIYTKRNAGCGMKGDVEFSILQADGTMFTVRWDDVVTENLFIKFTATSLDGVNPPNIAAIRAGLVTSFVPGVYEQVNVNALASAVQAIDPNTLVTNAGFSLTSGGSYTSTLTPSAKNKQFIVSSANVIILPLIVNPVADTAEDGDIIEFSALGGFGAYTWSLFTNISGGSIDSGSGEYVAGSTPGTDVVRVTDGLGNTKDANVVVS
jgi:hypothetical protein